MIARIQLKYQKLNFKHILTNQDLIKQKKKLDWRDLQGLKQEKMEKKKPRGQLWNFWAETQNYQNTCGCMSEKSENLQGDSDLYKEYVYQISSNSDKSSYVKLYKLSHYRILKFKKPENQMQKMD